MECRWNWAIDSYFLRSLCMEYGSWSYGRWQWKRKSGKDSEMSALFRAWWFPSRHVGKAAFSEFQLICSCLQLSFIVFEKWGPLCLPCHPQTWGKIILPRFSEQIPGMFGGIYIMWSVISHNHLFHREQNLKSSNESLIIGFGMLGIL